MTHCSTIATMQEEIRALAARARRGDPRPQLPGARGAGRRATSSATRSASRARRPRRTPATIVFCGVHFMAETAAILSPQKTVLIPDLDAGCSLAASISADQLRAWKAENPGAVVVSYVNTTAEVKAESDYCCTSGNAKGVIESIPEDTEILFLPGHVPRALAREGDGPQAAHLDGRVPRPRRDPPAGHHALAGRGARRRVPRPPRVRLREPDDGVREREDAHPLDGRDDQVREIVPEGALPRRDRDRDHPPAPEGGPRRSASRPSPRRRSAGT